jgi:hypothetical protein
MFCDTLARPYCEADYVCHMWPSLAIDKGVDACVQVVFSGYPSFCAPVDVRTKLEASLRAGTTVFDQAQFDTCLALLKSMSAGGAACTEAPLDVFSTTCFSAFRGQGAPGDACSSRRNSWPNGVGEDSVLSCKDGRCEDGKCVPFLKTGDACSLSINLDDYFANQYPATMLCNYPNQERCWGDPGAGGAGGSGGAGGAGGAGGGGGAEPMGTCRPQGDVGDACHPGNNRECKSYNCDATGKCAVPTGKGTWER